MMRVIYLLLLLPGLAFAQENDTLLGASLRTRPKYDGSSDTKLDVIPNIRYYGQPWFARTTQGLLEGGAHWKFGNGLEGGVQIAYEQGPLDEDPGASVGAHVEWEGKLGPAPINLLARFRQHLDTDRGAQVDTRLNVGLYKGHGFLAGAYAHATWASEKYFESYYAVRESGLLYTALGAFGVYDLTQRWLLLAHLEGRRLSDNAMGSVFVSQRTGTYAYAGVAYRF